MSSPTCALYPERLVTYREATSPALVRAIRAGTLDLAVVAQSSRYRSLDSESPGLDVSTLVERDLLVAVGRKHPLATRLTVDVEELGGVVWVGSPLRPATRRWASGGAWQNAQTSIRRA